MYVCIHNSRNINETVCPTAAQKVRRASQTKRIEMIYWSSLSDPYLLCMACWLGRPVIWLGTTVSIYNHIYIVMHIYLWNLTLQYNVLIGKQTIHSTLIDYNGMLLCARNNISSIIRVFFLCKKHYKCLLCSGIQFRVLHISFKISISLSIYVYKYVNIVYNTIHQNTVIIWHLVNCISIYQACCIHLLQR